MRPGWPPAGLEPDGLLVGGDADENDLAKVDQQGALFGFDLMRAVASAERFAQRFHLIVVEAGRDHLATVEADLDRSLAPGHQCSPAGSTISVRTEPVAAGWRKATRLWRMPV